MRIRPRNLFLVAITLLATSFQLSAIAQQGWSQAQIFKQGGKEATVNAVSYNGDEIWVVGADGLVARSFDEGRNFEKVDLNVTAGLNDVFVRKDDIWIIGDAGTIMLSTDGGRSFEKSPYKPPAPGSGSDPIDLYSVQFTDDRRGYIVGDDGLILASSDGGFSWREQRSGTNAQLFHLSFQGERGWVVGTGGVILHTDDSGRNWYPQRSGTSDDLNRVYLITDALWHEFRR
jgi:photosystem II stability/assembly factor-like uncharacterized protein